MTEKNEVVREWVSTGVKGLISCFIGVITWSALQTKDAIKESMSEMNNTMKELNVSIKALDQRVTIIETDRTARLEQYKMLIQDVQNVKSDMTQTKERINIIADFIAKMAVIKK